MITKNYLDILVEQLFLHFFNTPLLPIAAGFAKMPDLYLNNDQLFALTLSGLTSLVTGNSCLLYFHKIPDVSE